jgi:APA family basic amino acid/polyamine antiporter
MMAGQMTNTDDQADMASGKLGFWMCVALVMGNMIGSGVFLLPASLAPFGWNGVVGWAATITGALALALVLARLTLACPDAGGPVGFVNRAFGRTPSFLIGFSYWVSIWTANVTIAVAAISYLSVFAPVLGRYSAISTVALIWIITAINLRGTRTAGGFQVITLIIKLVPLVAVATIIILVLGREGMAPIAPFPATGLSLSAISGSAILTLWALVGFESASVAADKVSAPARTIPNSTIVGTLATGVLYLIICSGIALMLPVSAVANSEAPFAVFVEAYWAREPALLVALFAAVSAIGALNGWCLMQGELPAAMARRGLLPPWLAGETANGTPARALILSSLLASSFVIINSSKSMGDMFTFMATISTSATLWLYLACSAAAVRLKVAIPVATLGLCYALWALWGAGLDVSAMTLGLMVAGLPLYWWTVGLRPAAQPAE